MPLLSTRQWLRRVAFWVGAVLVGAAAIVFAALADRAGGAFEAVIAGRPWLPFLLAPAGLAVSVLLTRNFFPGAQGSGIPQVIAALHMREPERIDAMLSTRIAVGKVLLTLLGLSCGAIHRARGADGAGRCHDHARDGTHPALAPAGRLPRHGAGRRRGRRRRGLQHATCGRGVRHRGAEPFLRRPQLR